MEHPGNRPRELHDLMNYETEIPVQRLADQSLDVDTYLLLGLDRHGNIDVGGPIHQRQVLAQPGFALQTDG
jgi:hypothetical protein